MTTKPDVVFPRPSHVPVAGRMVIARTCPTPPRLADDAVRSLGRNAPTWSAEVAVARSAARRAGACLPRRAPLIVGTGSPVLAPCPPVAVVEDDR